MEVPYANFSRGFIANLNQRQDIADNPAIRKLLQVSTNDKMNKKKISNKDE